jgi:GGDEF domain-containing protein
MLERRKGPPWVDPEGGPKAGLGDAVDARCQDVLRCSPDIGPRTTGWLLETLRANGIRFPDPAPILLLLARIGGDGFFVVMDGATRADATRAAAAVQERVRALVLTTTRGQPVRTSVSTGCATFVHADPGAQAVVRAVEAALETARPSGKDALVSI